jgi:hypothetical protein
MQRNLTLIGLGIQIQFKNIGRTKMLTRGPVSIDAITANIVVRDDNMARLFFVMPGP